MEDYNKRIRNAQQINSSIHLAQHNWQTLALRVLKQSRWVVEGEHQEQGGLRPAVQLASHTKLVDSGSFNTMYSDGRIRL